MTRFFSCEECEGVFLELFKAGTCVDNKLDEIEVNTVDAAVEKHVPYITRNGDDTIDVVIGETIHPMEEEHYITFIALEQGNRFEIRKLEPGDEPRASFKLEEGPAKVYEFCNLHGIWSADVE